MFCPKCGTQNPDGAAFCMKCGAKMAADEQPLRTTQSPPPPPVTPIRQTPQQPAGTPPVPQQYMPQQYSVSPVLQKKKSKAPFIVLGIVGGIVALFILLIIIGMIADSQDEPPASQQESSAVTSSSAESDKVKLSKTYVNTNAGISFRYPAEWEKILDTDWDDYLSDSDGVLVLLAREDDDDPSLNSLILLTQFELDEEDQEIFFSDDDTFLDWFTSDEDKRTKETSVMDLDGIPARRITFVDSDGDGCQYYFYIAGNTLYRIDFLWLDEDAGELQPIFDAIMDSYTINKDKLEAAAETEQTAADPSAASEYQDMVLYKGIPVDYLLAASYDDIIEAFGEPDSSMFGGEEITYGSTGMTFEMFDWPEPYLCILESTTLDDFTYNGQALTTDRDGLTKIFGMSPEDNGFGQWCYSWDLMGQPVTLTADPSASSIQVTWWDTSNKEAPSLEPKLPDGYEWVTMPYVTKNEFGSQYIEGIIRNNTGSDKSYLQIEFTLYDTNGDRTDSAWDNITNLKNGDTWHFKAYTPGKGGTFKFAELTGW